jgi:hypothetical protein
VREVDREKSNVYVKTSCQQKGSDRINRSDVSFCSKLKPGEERK